MVRPTNKERLKRALKEFEKDKRIKFLLELKFTALYVLAIYYSHEYGLEFKTIYNVENRIKVAKKVSFYGNIQEYWQILMDLDPLGTNKELEKRKAFIRNKYK